MRYSKSFKLGISIVLLFTISFIVLLFYSVGAIVEYHCTVSDMESTEATIFENYENKRPGVHSEKREIYVSYEVGGARYYRELDTDTSLGFNPRIAGFYFPREKVKIFYNPQNPQIIAVPRSAVIAYISLVLSLIILSIFLIGLVKALKNCKMALVTEEAYRAEKLRMPREKKVRKKSVLEDLPGEKIRRQFFEGYLYIMGKVMLGVSLLGIVYGAKTRVRFREFFVEDGSSLLKAVLFVFAVYFLPFLILSYFNRRSFGRILCVMDETTLYFEDRQIPLDQIQEIRYEKKDLKGVVRIPGAYPAFIYTAIFVIRSDTYKVEEYVVKNFPLYALRKLKRYTYVRYDRAFFLVRIGIPALFAIMGLLLK